MALFGIAGDCGGARIPSGQDSFPARQIKVSFARVRIRSVALKTMVDKQRADSGLKELDLAHGKPSFFSFARRSCLLRSPPAQRRAQQDNREKVNPPHGRFGAPGLID
jgi:hypothetical protein